MTIITFRFDLDNTSRPDRICIVDHVQATSLPSHQLIDQLITDVDLLDNAQVETTRHLNKTIYQYQFQ